LPRARPRCDNCQRLLFRFADAYPRTSLDQCSANDRAEFLALLDALARTAARPVNLFVSRSLDRDMREHFAGRPRCGGRRQQQ
jgi:enoyl reductase-like protein